MIKSWMVIGEKFHCCAANFITRSSEVVQTLRRPNWLFLKRRSLWSGLYLYLRCLVSLCLGKEPGSGRTWFLMGLTYPEIVTIAYTPVSFCSLKVGNYLGNRCNIGILLTLAVLPFPAGQPPALCNLEPDWTTTWEMMRLNLVMYNSLHLSMPLGTVSKPNRAIAERISVDRNCWARSEQHTVKSAITNIRSYQRDYMTEVEQ